MLIAKLALLAAALGLFAWGFEELLELVAKVHAREIQRREFVAASRVVSGRVPEPARLERPAFDGTCGVCEKPKPIGELRRFVTVVHRRSVLVCVSCVGRQPKRSSWTMWWN